MNMCALAPCSICHNLQHTVLVPRPFNSPSACRCLSFLAPSLLIPVVQIAISLPDHDPALLEAAPFLPCKPATIVLCIIIAGPLPNDLMQLGELSVVNVDHTLLQSAAPQDAQGEGLLPSWLTFDRCADCHCGRRSCISCASREALKSG